MVFALAMCSFQTIFNPQGMCFNGLYFVLWKDTSVTLAVRRPK